MQISEIQIALVHSENGLVGFASLVLEEAIYLGSIGIFARPTGGYRLTYPMRKNTDKKLNFFYPIKKKIAEQIEQAVITKLKEILQEQPQSWAD